MKLNTLFFLTVVGRCFAAQYSIDKSCNSNEHAGFRDGIVAGWQEALDLINNAFDVMTNHAGDEKVQAMCRYLFGNADFDNKFNQARATLGNIRVFARDPSPFEPQDDRWKATRSNADVEVYCDAVRIVPEEGTKYHWDTAREQRFWADMTPKLQACHDPRNTNHLTMATTWKSDLFDMGRYFKAKRAARAIGGTAAAAAVDRALFTTLRPTHVNTMDLCFWFLKLMADRNWPKIDSEQVELAKTPEFINALTGAKLPVDGLQTMSGLFVHEMTHTNQGGSLVDQTENDIPGAGRQCYGWRCCGLLQDVRNSDTIHMLAVALKIWSLKHWVNADGQIIPL